MPCLKEEAMLKQNANGDTVLSCLFKNLGLRYLKSLNLPIRKK